MIGLHRLGHAVVRRWNDKTLPRLAGFRYTLEAGNAAAALTFDDGPDPRFTPALLDLLAQAETVATFFVVGRRARAHPGIVRRILDEGHAVGSHTWSHPDPRGLSLRRLVAECRDGRAAVEDVVGRPVPLYRPPMGHIDVGGVVAIRRTGVRPWLWNRDPEDWRPGVAPARIMDSLTAVRGCDVVLLHDGIELPLAPEAHDRSATLAAVREFVWVARNSGLRFATLD